MSTHDNEPASEDEGQQQTPSEEPEPSEDAKAKASEMMSSYKDRPTLVLPGTGGTITGTAINDCGCSSASPPESACSTSRR